MILNNAIAAVQPVLVGGGYVLVAAVFHTNLPDGVVVVAEEEIAEKTQGHCEVKIFIDNDTETNHNVCIVVKCGDGYYCV
ncbi:MAG: hypothetical protein LBJ10_02290 [Clostridiales bacterium]|nr:hypothetical protein [Clostridiales bacterium]